jgi:hypothetical protein
MRITPTTARRTAAVLTVLAAGVGAAAVADAQSGGSPADPDPGSMSTVTSAVPTVPDGPPRLTAQDADRIAREDAAQRGGDAAPGRQQAFAASRGEATAAIFPGGEEQVATAGKELGPWYASPVYVEVLHGRFTFAAAPRPAGEKAPTGSVLTEIVDAKTGQISAVAVTNAEPPALDALGTPREVASDRPD